jgi:hypothetical protein
LDRGCAVTNWILEKPFSSTILETLAMSSGEQVARRFFILMLGGRVKNYCTLWEWMAPGRTEAWKRRGLLDHPTSLHDLLCASNSPIRSLFNLSCTSVGGAGHHIVVSRDRCPIQC